MPVVILLFILFALLAFIVWERRRTVAPLSRERMAIGWAPPVLLRWPALASIFVCTVTLGVAEWVSPAQPPFTGRLSSLMSLAYEHFGPRGIVLVWFAASMDRGRRSDFAWQIWTFDWQNASSGEHSISSRAVDRQGNIQPAMDDARIAGKRTYWESNGQVTRRVRLS